MLAVSNSWPNAIAPRRKHPKIHAIQITIAEAGTMRSQRVGAFNAVICAPRKITRMARNTGYMLRKSFRNRSNIGPRLHPIRRDEDFFQR